MISFQIQWTLDSVDVAGQTSNTFGPITNAMRGKRLGFRLIGTGSNGLPSAPVTAPPVLIPPVGVALTITGTPAAAATVGTPYSFVPTISGGTPPYTASMPSGTLPTGLSFNSVTGAITGTPTTPQTQSNLVIRATDQLGATADLQAFSITVSAAANSLVFTAPTANGSPYTASHGPVYRDAYVCMSPTVAQNDERIDVQLAIGTPYTPEATSVTITGAAAIWFDSYQNSQLVFKAATRASVPRGTTLSLTVNAVNAQGSSEQSTLNVWVPAAGQSTNGEVFVDFANGSDANTGAFGSPLKHLPGTADYTGAAKAYSAGQTIFFAGDSLHKTYLGASNLASSGYPPPLNQSGANLTSPIRYAFNGWKGQAKISGARDENGTVTSASGAECFNSPSVANLKAQTVSTAIEWFQGVFWRDGEVQGFLAQYPRPTTLADRFKPGIAAAGTNGYNGTTSDGGWKQVFYTTNSGDTTPVRLYYNGASSYLQDAALDVHFNTTSVGLNANGIGVWVMLWDSTNNVTVANVTSFDVSTHRITFSSPSLSTDGGYTAYALLNSPYDVQIQGQYSSSLNGLKIISYPPATPGQVSVSRERYGAMISTNANVAYHQLWCQGFSGGFLVRNGASSTNKDGGAAIMSRNNSGANVTGISVYGLRTHNNCNGDELGLGIMATGSEYQAAGGMYQWVLHRIHYSDNWMGRGRSATAPTRGVATGSGPGGMPTKAEVADPTARNKVWWGYVAPYGATKSIEYTTQSRGLHYKENVVRNYSTVHGDVNAWYAEDDTPGHAQFNDHHYQEREFGDNALRWKTTSYAYGYLPAPGLSNWYDGCVVLGDTSGSNTGLSLFSGDPSATYTSCVFLQSSRSTGPSLACMALNQGFGQATVQNSILNGITTNLTPIGGVPATFSVLNNGITVTISTPGNLPVNDVPNNRLVSGNSQLSVQPTWDGVTIAPSWKPILRAGGSAGTVKIGPFPDWLV